MRTAREKFQMGQRVKFSSLALERFRRFKLERRGIVAGFCRDFDGVRVKWDSRKDAEAWHIDFIEVAALIVLALFFCGGARAQSPSPMASAISSFTSRSSSFAGAPVKHSNQFDRLAKAPILSILQIRDTTADVAHCRDRAFCAASYAYLGAYALDMAGTHTMIARGGYEAGPLFTGARSTAKVSLAYGLVTLANFTVAHWMKHSNRRWIRAAWWIPLAYGGVTHADAGIRDERWHLAHP